MASPILSKTLPANLYPLTWLLPSGRLLIQSNWDTVLLDYKANTETPLDDMPDAVRVYPASAGTIMLPLTPTNNYTATILFCGGSNITPDQYVLLSDILPADLFMVLLGGLLRDLFPRHDRLPRLVLRSHRICHHRISMSTLCPFLG